MPTNKEFFLLICLLFPTLVVLSVDYFIVFLFGIATGGVAKVFNICKIKDKIKKIVVDLKSRFK